MTLAFMIAGVVAVVATLMVITRANAVHALLYLIVSLLAAAVAFYALGAPFAAALEVIVYAGAIVVLFVFVVILLNLGPATEAREKSWLRPVAWAGPATLSVVLLAELAWLLARGAAPPGPPNAALRATTPAEVGRTLLDPYLLGVELASMLLLAGLVGAFHVGREIKRKEPVKS